MKSMAAAAGAALISGVVMYTAGARTAEVNAFVPAPALVETGDGQGPYLAATPTALQPRPVRSEPAPPAAAPAVRRPARAQARPAAERREPSRSWTKTAMIIGGSAASGAGVGGIVDGRKGALIGAAIGGGAASIYEATRRR